MPSDAPQAPEAFAGRWRIARRIDDRRAGQVGRFEGAAEFRTDGPGRLRYEEAGVLTLGGAAPMRAERVYLWAFAGDRVAVLFADGRPFHAFDLKEQAQAEHWCDPDAYAVAYDFSDWPAWRTVWTVRGPAKDYVMDSAYSRA